MDRADILVMTRTGASPDADEAISRLTEYPVFAARTKLLGFRRLWNEGPVLRAEEMDMGPFFAFCGIGNPGAFLMDLKNWKLEIVGREAFADHHQYSDGEIQELLDAAREAGARALVTTEKDAQNMADVEAVEMPVYVAVIEVEFPQEQIFLETIRRHIPQWKAPE